MNLWILTEERPKTKALRQILAKFAEDGAFDLFMDDLRILPILEDGRFAFVYELAGFRCDNKLGKVYIKTISGYSSFVDFLVFYQDKEPTAEDAPIYAIEETKTDDSESRNTGVYQRCAKFVFLDRYYPEVPKIMLYNLQVEQKETPTETNIFGSRMLLTMGVEILGKKKFGQKPFGSIDELIAFKKGMRPPPKGNVPIDITKRAADKIEVSGRLFKSGSLSHDPNIGALSIIGATLRKLGWKGNITITKHGLEQKHLGARNKFVVIANALGLELQGLKLPEAELPEDYWHYDSEGEKLGTIFLHIAVESFSEGHSIFENHAGCEKGYFMTLAGRPVPLAKYQDRAKYKAGDKKQIIAIPDLILLDSKRGEIIAIEGKKYKFRQDGINELAAFDAIEESYIKKHYPGFSITRSVVLYGGKEKEIAETEIGFLLNEDGGLVLGANAPALFADAIETLPACGARPNA